MTDLFLKSKIIIFLKKKKDKLFNITAEPQLNGFSQILS